MAPEIEKIKRFVNESTLAMIYRLIIIIIISYQRSRARLEVSKTAAQRSGVVDSRDRCEAWLMASMCPAPAQTAIIDQNLVKHVASR